MDSSRFARTDVDAVTKIGCSRIFGLLRTATAIMVHPQDRGPIALPRPLTVSAVHGLARYRSTGYRMTSITRFPLKYVSTGLRLLRHRSRGREINIVVPHRPEDAREFIG